MRCEHCDKNEATITYTTVEGNETKEMHVCSSCFQKLLKAQFPTAQLPPLDIQSVMQELLSMFQTGVEADSEDRTCPGCQTTLSQFRKTGMFGCDQCYDTFQEELEKLLPRIQGAEKHVGEAPQSFKEEAALSEREAELQNKLERAVAEERYEDAALLRDELKALKEVHHEG